jgi:hypothetical protein
MFMYVNVLYFDQVPLTNITSLISLSPSSSEKFLVGFIMLFHSHTHARTHTHTQYSSVMFTPCHPLFSSLPLVYSSPSKIPLLGSCPIIIITVVVVLLLV